MKRKHLAVCLITLVSMLCSGLGIKNIQTEKAIAEEVSAITIEQDFDGSSVLVTMTEEMSEINKVYSPSFFGNIEIESVEDLTYIEGNIEEKLYLNRESFQQILQLHLPIASKENVLSVIQEVEKINGVENASPNYYEECALVPNDSSYNSQWGLHGTNGINAPSAWDIITGSQDVKVGIIDTGIAAHPDLNDNLAAGYDFVNNDTTTTDDPTGHGTHVAGIIGAVGNNNKKGVVGVNWSVTLVPLQVVYDALNDSNEKTHEWKMKTNAVTAAITYAITNNIPVLNYSAGGNASGGTEFLKREAELKNYTGLFVCAAGNGGDDSIGDNNDTIKHYPSDYADETNLNYSKFSDRVISVGSITDWGSRATSSNYGANSVSIYAPGGNIYSTIPNNSYGYKSGTSMAAPHVTGVAALMLARNPLLTAAELKDYILSSADTITITLPDNTTQQVKKLNAYQAVSTIPTITTTNIGENEIELTAVNYQIQGDVKIPDTIKGRTVIRIGNSAFSGKTNVTSVTIPNTVTDIGRQAFMNCTALTSISMPSVEEIGNSAFLGCANLEELTLPSGLESVGDDAFAQCSSLVEVEIPEGVTSIGDSAFFDCESLTTVYLPDTITSLGWWSFDWCYALETVYYNIPNLSNYTELPCVFPDESPYVETSEGYEVIIGNNVTHIPAYLFAETNVATVTLGTCVTSIGQYAFNDCTGLTSVTIPINVTSIGDCAFEGCTALTSVNIPSAVTSIGVNVFAECAKLKTVNYNAVNCGDIGSSGAFTGAGSLVSGVKFIIGETVSRLPAYLFYGIDHLKTIQLSPSIATVATNAFAGVDMAATGVQWIYANGTGVVPTGLEDYVNEIIIAEGVTGICEEAFSECFSVRKIYFNAVNCADLPDEVFADNYYDEPSVQVVLGESVTRIPDGFLTGISNLTAVRLSASVTTVAPNAFSGIDMSEVSIQWFYGLGTGAVPEALRDYVTEIIVTEIVSSIGANAFAGCYEVRRIYYNAVLCGNIDEEGAFFDCGIDSEEEWLEIIIGSSVRILPNYLFHNLPSMTKVRLSPSIEWVGTNAFERHYDDMVVQWLYGEGTGEVPTYLKEYVNDIIFEEGVTSICENAFYGCERLEFVVIPNTVTSIGANAFYDCGMFDVILPESVEYVGAGAFETTEWGGTLYIYNAENMIELGDHYENVFTCEMVYVQNSVYWDYMEADDWEEIRNRILVMTE